MARAPNERWSHFAERVANAFGLVLVLVLTTYVLGSLTPFHGWTAVLTTSVAVATAVIGLAGAQVRPLFVRVALIAGLAAVILAIIAAIGDGRHLLGASSLLVAILMLIAAGAILHAVLGEAQVGFRTILGAISVYGIFGILFSFLYGSLDRIQSSPFFGPGVTVKGGDFIFFSFTTLTTTGYGNLVPAAQPGKMFAGLEMLMGQIFLVTLVAGLVSLWRPSRLIRRRGEEG